MKIKHLTKDPNWIKRVEEIGYGYHTDGENPYWVDHYYYAISEQFADKIYHATEELWDMCLQAVEHVITHKKYDLFHIPNFIQHHIEKSWENDVPSIYGRFDFAYDSIKDQLKMLEFNADTPTSLFECGVVQWFWKEHFFKKSKDQFNNVHDQLIQSWKDLKPYLKGSILHFTCVRESLEDLTNVEYLRDTAIQAGINTKLLYIDEIGWNGQCFTDLEEQEITSIFKLYPWEWMVNEEFGFHIVNDVLEAQWVEPSWKMILSNKAILPILWELYPNHPLLLESYFNNPKSMISYVKKPLLSREGANISMVYNDRTIFETEGEYGAEGFIYQELAQLHKESSGYSIIGSWIIGQQPSGITFRESDYPITTDKSRFIPHILE
ncbi:glutathionylspermidine synthase family protein [Flavobacterium sp. xlx-214]|uniref:glutathionylspermidine synthase family protein n=1 Tax=unclassified Flavobacterium TaxID=196869 RepID=UPI0013D1059D|nr:MULTISPECIES: glutathionylspermidine synthase family protein [unclassified Flavobacterium]MBA5793117.1 glutathionylspermidine synthase family protein [Flavobacterium sp. xlx-221]QMI82596.1 glutathionylspermidine synthase family protein [Flavobacterium sp. xlx-214]